MKHILVVAMLVAASSFVFSQPTRIGVHAQTGKPGPEHKRLEVFVGSWTWVADLKPGIFGPAGKCTGVERFQWLPGEFFLQMNREGKCPGGDLRQTIIFGYDPVNKRHTGTFFDHTSGGSTSATTTTSGNTWKWAGTGYTGEGKGFQERCTLTLATGGGSSSLTCEIATDGKTWTPSWEAKYTKSK